jgi:nifR3 family TIM-barrel protein
MRLLCFEYGADFAVTEMASAEGLVRGGEGTRRLLERLPGEGPVGVQLFGSDPGALAEGAAIAAATGPAFIDLNFGCPVRKVLRQGAGAALMRDIGMMYRIARAVSAAVTLPVTAKIRSGWSEDEERFVEAGRALEAGGCSAVTLHPRFRSQGFTGAADWDHLARLRRALSIPVIASGDVLDLDSYRRIVEITGCEVVMIGRGAFGRPWIFDDIREGLTRGVEPRRPFGERASAILRLARMEAAWKGERQAVAEMRKHYRWFLRGIPGVRDHRARLGGARSLEEVEAVIGDLAAEVE